jgi:subfamily B ATP-binding cassette protein HlyB/CyaB
MMKFFKQCLVASKTMFVETGPVDAPTLTAMQARWLVEGFAFLCQKSPPVLDLGEAVGLDTILDCAREYGFEFEAAAVAGLADEASYPSDARFVTLVRGESGALVPALILGRKGDDYLFATSEAQKPRPVKREALQAVLRTASGAGPLLKFRQIEKLAQAELEAFGWKWFATAFFKRKAVVRDVLISALILQLIALLFPLATQTIVDKVIQNQAVNTLIAVGLGIGLFALFSAGLTWLRQKFLLRLANIVDSELAGEVLSHLFKLPLRYFESRATGVLINRVHGLERIREFFSGAFVLVALDLPFMMIFLALMLSYSGTLSAVVGAFVIVMVGVSFAVGPILRNRINTQSQLGAKVQGYLTEHVAAAETIKSLQLEPQTVGRFQRMNRAYLDASLSTRELGNGYSTFMSFIEQAMNGTVLCVGAYIAMGSPGLDGSVHASDLNSGSPLTIGMLVAFQMFAQRVVQPLLKLSSTWQELQQVRVAVQLLGDILNTPPELYSTIPTAQASHGEVSVEGLGFRYAPDKALLYSNLNFTVGSGKVLLVTGASGSGKSTLSKILMGMYRDFEGNVKIGGRSLRSLSANELRRSFGVVPQDTVLFSGTLLENLLNAAPGATFDQVVDACTRAGVHDAIANLPKGYESEVGERGVGLSGGQRQRVGIARALLRQPKILIFDEATSSLDAESASHIAETVNQMRGFVTILFVAHHVPPNLYFDQHLALGQE